VCRDIELQFGDAAFEGNGPEGTCTVGFERKKLADLINSMKDRRLSGRQLRGMWQAYDFIFLVAEGLWREGDGSEIEEWAYDRREQKWRFMPVYGNGGGDGGRNAISYEQLDHYTCTLELKGGLVYKRTRDERETARYYASRWRWFNSKAWVEHRSHDQLYHNEPQPAKGHGNQWGLAHEHDEEYERPGRGRAQLIQANPTTCWRWAADLPGLDRKAEVVAKHFRTAWNMALAGLDPELKKRAEEWMRQNPHAALREWEGIDFGMKGNGSGRNPGIGPVTAAAVIRAITEEGA